MTIISDVVSKLLNAFQYHINKDVNIDDLVSRYGTAHKIVLFQVPDAKVQRFLRIKDNQLIRLEPNSIKPDIFVKIDSRALINIVKGQVTKRWPDGKIYTESYTPMDAYREGRLVIRSVTDKEGKNGWLSDLTLFGKELFEQVFPYIQPKVQKALKKIAA